MVLWLVGSTKEGTNKARTRMKLHCQSLLKSFFVFFVSHLPMLNALVLSCRQIYDYIFATVPLPVCISPHLLLSNTVYVKPNYWFGVCRNSIAIKHAACDPGRDD